MKNEKFSPLFHSLIGAGGYIALFSLMKIVAVYAYVLIAAALDGGKTPDLSSGSTLLAINILGDCFALLLGVIICSKRSEEPIEMLGIKKFSPRLILPIILCATACCTFMLIAINIIPFPKGWVDSYNESTETLSGSMPLLSVFFTVILVPVTEEIIFRSLAYGRLKAALSPYLAAAIISVCFGMMHGTLISFFYCLLLGFLINVIFIRTGSVLATILFHSVFNFIGLYIGGLLNELSYDKIILIMAVSFLIAATMFAAILNMTKKTTVR